MNRRTFLKALPVATAAALGGAALHRGGPWRRPGGEPTAGAAPAPLGLDLPETPPPLEPLRDEGSHLASDAAASPRSGPALEKIRDFDRAYDDDHLLPADRLGLLGSTTAHLQRAQEVIGHGHFNILAFDDLLRYARRYSKIGAFSPRELEFLEEIFAADARTYGFYGKKVVTEITDRVPRRTVRKIAGSGHYLFDGESFEKFRKLRRDLGQRVVLTSGVRGVVKQFHLFLDKAVRTGGNLSQASRSLAPPGYSYHAVGDFDVGKVGLGAENFTEAFARTDEYKKMIDLGYVEIRYTETNPYGVRHEPWHIKIGGFDRT